VARLAATLEELGVVALVPRAPPPAVPRFAADAVKPAAQGGALLEAGAAPEPLRRRGLSEAAVLALLCAKQRAFFAEAQGARGGGGGSGGGGGASGDDGGGEDGGVWAAAAAAGELALVDASGGAALAPLRLIAECLGWVGPEV